MKKASILTCILAVTVLLTLSFSASAQILTNNFNGYTGTPTLPIPPGGWSSYARLTNSTMTDLWFNAPAGATNVTFTDLSGQPSVVLKMTVKRRSDLKSWSGTNSLSFNFYDARLGTNYSFSMTDYVVSNSVPAGTQLNWQAVWK